MDEDEWKEYFRRIFKMQRRLLILQTGQEILAILTFLSVGILIFFLLLMGD